MVTHKSKKPAKSALPIFDIESLLAAGEGGCLTASYQAQDFLYRQGDPAETVFYIVSGTVQIVSVSERGKEVLVGALSEGAFLGEACLAGQPLHLASGVAMEETVAVQIHKDTMVRCLRELPLFGAMFTAFLLSRNIEIEADLVNQLFNSSETRLAKTLLVLANFGKESSIDIVIPKIDPDALAARVGVTRSKIDYFLNKFRKLGFIDYNGGLRIHASLLNVIIADVSDEPETRHGLGPKRISSNRRTRR